MLELGTDVSVAQQATFQGNSRNRGAYARLKPLAHLMDEELWKISLYIMVTTIKF